MLVEPPPPHVRRERGAPGLAGLGELIPTGGLRSAAFAAATASAATATGDAFLLAVLLGLGAASVGSGVVAGLAALSLLLRWGASSLAGLAGAQAVLGPALLAGTGWEAAGAAAAAVAVVMAAPRGWAAVPFGLTAGLLAAGPAPVSGGDAIVRLAGAAAGVGAALAAGMVPGRVRLVAAGAAAVSACVLVAVGA